MQPTFPGGTKDVWDHYVKKEKIGTGKFSRISAAMCTKEGDEGTMVAVKKISPDPQADGINLVGLRELNMLGELQHENIIRLIEPHVHNSTLYLVLEGMLCDVQDCIENERLKITENDIRMIILQLLHGLKFLHSRGVIHRDLKPANLLLSATGVLKIADFGSASSSGELTQTTLNFQAPETMWGWAEYSGATDMWAVGCCLANLLKRGYLFEGDRDSALQCSIAQFLEMSDEFKQVVMSRTTAFLDAGVGQLMDLSQALPRASEEALEMVRGLLRWDPAERWTVEQCLASDFLADFALSQKDCQAFMTRVVAAKHASKPKTRVHRVKRDVGLSLDQTPKRSRLEDDSLVREGGTARTLSFKTPNMNSSSLNESTLLGGLDTSVALSYSTRIRRVAEACHRTPGDAARLMKTPMAKTPMLTLDIPEEDFEESPATRANFG